jgi:hypothetical protein
MQFAKAPHVRKLVCLLRLILDSRLRGVQLQGEGFQRQIFLCQCPIWFPSPAGRGIG